MKDLMSLDELKTISSKEIANLTEKRHDHVLRDIRSLIDQGAINAPNFELADYVDKKGERRPMYELDKEASLVLATGYNAVLRSKIVRRWIELEAKAQIVLPKDYPSALRALADVEEKRLLLESENKELLPKAEFFDAVADSKTAVDLGRVAKVLDMGIGRNKLFEYLRDLKILMRNNQPYQKYIDAGYFRVVEQKFVKDNGDTHIYIKTLVYQRGLDLIRVKVNELLDNN